jgi:hypothetical protein
LWNRNIVDQPKLPAAADMPWVEPFANNPHALARCFLLICLLRQLLRVINPTSSWADRMKQHLLCFPDLEHMGVNQLGMGAPVHWAEQWP